MTDVSSWFIDQSNNNFSEPKRIFVMANSDHSGLVKKWPSIKRSIETVKPVNVQVTLSNIGGEYNKFYENLYSIPASCYFDIGFTHPESGDELVRVYTGVVEKVSYSKEQCQVFIKDKFHKLSLIKIGSTETPIDFTSQIPSDIAWSICTSFGGVSAVESSSNLDIDYLSFQEWAATFSADAVTTTANYKGKVLTEAVADFCKYTDSFSWVSGEGKLVFQRFNEVSSLDFTLDEGKYKDISFDIDIGKLVNRQFVDYNYSVASEYWQNRVTAVDSTSVNSYSARDGVHQSENIWFTSSGHASTLANRMITRLGSPPREFGISMPLFGIHREPGNTVRLVSSFYQVSSGSGFRVNEQSFNLDTLSVKVKTNDALVASGFYLDKSFLDGDDLLL